MPFFELRDRIITKSPNAVRGDHHDENDDDPDEDDFKDFYW